MEARGCAIQDTPHPVHAELVQIFSSTEVEVTRTPEGSVLVIPSDLLFAAGGLELRREAAMVVDLLGTALGLHPALQIELRGHTDDLGVDDPMARSLGTARTLMDALVADHALDPGRFTVAGRGAADPRAPGDTPGDRAQNRRVEIHLRLSQGPD
jgi:flagellar motor protein MotB